MAYQIVVAGGNVYRVNTSGAATALTLPTDVTIDSTKPARMAVLNGYVVIVNAPSRSITVDDEFVVRPLQVQAPSAPPTLDVTGGTGLTPTAGGYRVKYTFGIKDPDTGALIAESAFSPASAVTGNFSNKAIKAYVAISPDASVNVRKLYRTTDGGAVYFPWIELDGNVTTSVTNSMSDTALQLIAAPTTLGVAPGAVNGSAMKIITEWKDRLWGVGDTAISVVRHTDVNSLFTWDPAHEFTIPPPGEDDYGITGFMRRRDELGIARRHSLWKIVGDSNDTFQREKVIDGVGCFAPDSVVIIRDQAYFLAEDGIYKWSDAGVKCISDEGKVRKWFTSDTYFNRAKFPNAFGKYNFKYNRYELHLANLGSSNIDRWIEYDIDTGKFYGPHLTAADTPTAVGTLIDSNDITLPVIGSSGGFLLSQNQTAFTDVSSAISCSLTTPRYHGNTPDIKKVWGADGSSGRFVAIFKKQSATGNLSIAASIGNLSATTTRTLSVDMSTGNRQKFSPLGTGEYCQLIITESTNSQGAELYGFELPFFEIGSR